jgi:hypothetical protein
MEGSSMKRLALVAVSFAALISLAGWIRSFQANDFREVRIEQMLYASEHFGHPGNPQPSRFWFTDMPSHLMPQRVHGGIVP